MVDNQRGFVDALKKYCVARGIEIEVRSGGWLVIMQRGSTRRLAFGYDVGLNNAVASKVANDKAATAEVLQGCGIPCVAHTFFPGPQMSEYVPPQRSWEPMLALLEQNPAGIVLKPNEGTSGKSVFKVLSVPELELAAYKIFSTHLALAASPYLEIQNEVRVILLDGCPLIVYRKDRPAIIGDGKLTLLELALATTPAEQRSTVLPAMLRDFGKPALDEILPPGKLCFLNWRHNLDTGARPILLEQGAARDACVAIAAQAAKAIGIRFASFDVVQVNGSWQILEVNSGVMMEALAKLHPDLVYDAYSAALDKLFDQNGHRVG
jgi:hypothetical protein